MIESEVRLFSVQKLLASCNQDRRPLNKEKAREYSTSISQRGLIHTVLVERGSDRLIAGAHRCLAFQLLQGTLCPYPDYSSWTHIPGRYAYDVDESEVEALELEENIKRHDLTWQEQCDAVRRFHSLCERTREDWNMSRTAESLGMSTQHISRFLLVAKEIETGNDRVAKATTLSAAHGIVSRQLERALASEIEILKDVHNEEMGEEAPTGPSFEESILQTDFCKWIETYSGPKFNFIHCDFPYGVNMQDSEQGRAQIHGEYDDTPETFWKLFNSFFENLDRFCSKSAHIMFWFSMKYYEQIMQKLQIPGMIKDYGFEEVPDRYEGYTDQYDLVVDPFPLMWFKSDNKGILPDRERGPRRVYETALLISRGDRKIIQPVANCYAAPTTKEIHLSEKPESMLRHFFRMFVDDQTRLLDPTCGSGTALRAAEAYGAVSVLGLDIAPIDEARDALLRSRNLRALAQSTGGRKAQENL